MSRLDISVEKGKKCFERGKKIAIELGEKLGIERTFHKNTYNMLLKGF